jgi:hypothetical protein
MRPVAIACLWACSSATANEPDAPAAVLLIGNSLTYSNDLPSLLAGVARAAGDSIRVGMAAGPNLAVIDHTNGSTDALVQIDGHAWNYVVLQQGPTPAGICRDTLIIAAMRFAPHIEAAGGRAVLWLPWARQANPQSLDFAGESATLAARAVGGVVAPVGIAWKMALDADPTLPLYDTDGYHPAPAGSALAALTIYDRLFGHDVRMIPVGSLNERLGLPLGPGQIQALANAAHGASISLPPDSPMPVPADTTRLSPGGGPC